MKDHSILILGARSDIGMAIARRFAKEKYEILLAARNAETLNSDISDIKIRYGVKTTLYNFDVLKSKSYKNFINELPKIPSIVISAVGLMGTQTKSEIDTEDASIIFRSNFEGPANILSIFANKFLDRGYGTIVGISSVAGERGRASNYIYGSAKAGFTAYLSGLRNRVFKKNVHVLTVIPGYVSTKMTEGLKLPLILTSTPYQVAEIVFNAIINKKNVVYAPKIWRYIMFIIKSLPENLFKYTRL